MRPLMAGEGQGLMTDIASFPLHGGRWLAPARRMGACVRLDGAGWEAASAAPIRAPSAPTFPRNGGRKRVQLRAVGCGVGKRRSAGDLARDRGGRRRRRPPVMCFGAVARAPHRPFCASAAVEGSSSPGAGGDPLPARLRFTRFVPVPHWLSPRRADAPRERPGAGLSMPGHYPLDRPRRTSQVLGPGRLPRDRDGGKYRRGGRWGAWNVSAIREDERDQGVGSASARNRLPPFRGKVGAVGARMGALCPFGRYRRGDWRRRPHPSCSA